MMHPYRTAPATEEPPRSRWWKRAWCWLVAGHRWEVTRDAGVYHLAHLHPYAGCDAFCIRCGATWLDFDSHVVTGANTLAGWVDSLRQVRASNCPDCGRLVLDQLKGSRCGECIAALAAFERDGECCASQRGSEGS